MKILQLVSDWRWTGIAEPMLILTDALRARGHQVDLMCPEPPLGTARSLWQEALLRKLDPIQPIDGSQRVFRWGDGERARRLSEWLETDELGGPYDIVHCWHPRDHVIAARALRLGNPFRERSRKTQLVRFLPQADRMRRWPWNRWLFGVGCDGLICASEAATESIRDMRGGRAVATVTGSIDFDELASRQHESNIRRALGVGRDVPLIGVVARLRPRRGFDLLLQALSRLIQTHPRACLVLIGRGRRAEQVIRQPARELGLEGNLIFAGGRFDDQAEVLAAMDLRTLLVPARDGTCQSLLRAAALGIPMVGTRRGAIPEIISNGQTGLLVEEEPEALASAWRRLMDDPVGRREMGAAARRDARFRFQPDRHAAWMERFYERTRERSLSAVS